MSTVQQSGSWNDQLLRVISEAVVFTDLDGVVTFWGDAAVAMFGWPDDEAVGSRIDDLIVPIGPAHSSTTEVLRAVGAGDRLEGQIVVGGRSSTLPVQAAAVPQLDVDGQVVGMICVFTDLSARREAEAALAHSEVRFQRVFDESPVGKVIVEPDEDLTIQRVNPAFAEMLGYTPTELVGRALADVSHPDDLAIEIALGVQMITGEIPYYAFEKRLIRKDGSMLTCRATGTVVCDEQGNALYGIGMAQDISNEVAARDTIRRQKERLDLVLEAAGVCTWEVDLATMGLELSDNAPAVFQLQGYPPPTDVQGFIAHVHPDDRHVFDLDAPEDPDERYTIDFRVLIPGRDPLWIRQVGAYVFDDEGIPVAIRGTAVDATERRTHERRIAEQALTDELTGLPNRALLLDRLQVGIRHLEGDGGPFLAVLFVDIDRFKVVNESLGHRIGDELLVQASRRLRAALGPDVTVARFGGDEFVVMFEQVEHATQVVSLAQQVFEVLQEPFVLDGRDHYLSVSIGIVPVTNRKADADEVVRDADAAASQAKANGGGTFEIFDEQIRSEAVARLEVEDDLRRGIAADELVVFHQPVVTLQGQVIGFEALVRWQHPTRGLVLPDLFIPVAEETGLILPIGRTVLHRALGQLATWRREREDSADWTMAVNLSSRQLVEPGLVDEVVASLDEHHLEGAALRLELTESALMSDRDEVDVAVAGLRAHGVRLSVDDFGTGYSSLVYLRRFPVDVVKLDRVFVQGVTEDQVDRAIVASMIALAHDLGMEAVAEGVETMDQLEVLRSLGCDAAQGYYWSPPEAAHDLEERLLAGSAGGPTLAILRGVSV